MLQNPEQPCVTIGFCRSRSVPSRLIEWFGAGHYSHVTTLMPDRVSVIDARLHGGVKRRPVSYLKNTRVTWVDLLCDSELQSLKVYSFLTAQIGKRYDITGIIDFVTGYNRDPNWKTKSAWFCDELAAAACEYAGLVARPWFAPTFRLTPGAFAAMVSQCRIRFSTFKI